MVDKILNKFDFSNPNYDREIIFLILAVWMMVIGCAIWSILTQKTSKKWKIVWICVVTCVPFLGLLAYLPFSLKGELYPFIGFWRNPK